MRLFAALDLDEEARAELTAVAWRFRDAPGVKWTKPESLHVTLRYFGEWPEERLPKLIASLAAVERPDASFEIRFSRLAFLPNERAPKVFVAVAETPKPLAEFQGRIEQATRELGFKPERRAFLTHLTLGRIRDTRQGRKLADLARTADVALPSFTPEVWGLYQSETRPTGAVYTKLAGWPTA